MHVAAVQVLPGAGVADHAADRGAAGVEAGRGVVDLGDVLADRKGTIAFGLFSWESTPSFCCTVWFTQGRDDRGDAAAERGQEDVDDPRATCGRNGEMGAFGPPTCRQFVVVHS